MSTCFMNYAVFKIISAIITVSRIGIDKNIYNFIYPTCWDISSNYVIYLKHLSYCKSVSTILRCVIGG